MTILRSEDWTEAHAEVSESLSSLLNLVRDIGYNPSLHIRYDGSQHRLTLDEALLAKHFTLGPAYRRYQDACEKRDAALGKIQELPKLDIGF